MEVEIVTAPCIKRRLPTEIRIRTCVALLMFLPGLYLATFKTHQLDVSLLAATVLAFFFLINHGMDWGYQLAFDETRMYQRPKGWRWFFRRLPWYAITYDEVSRIETIFGADGGMKRRFFAFEFILIYGRSGRDGDNVVIYPPAFRDRDIKDFLLLLYAKKPELFPAEVVDYMNSDAAL
jgi:hypothetical protein